MISINNISIIYLKNEDDFRQQENREYHQHLHRKCRRQPPVHETRRSHCQRRNHLGTRTQPRERNIEGESVVFLSRRGGCLVSGFIRDCTLLFPTSLSRWKTRWRTQNLPPCKSSGGPRTCLLRRRKITTTTKIRNHASGRKIDASAQIYLWFGLTVWEI